ncbi:MAG: hypothetical protein JW830_03740 [Bacteroidales bacterium]|nr:hypothetical protein [Bacteroidales bacterium]
MEVIKLYRQYKALLRGVFFVLWIFACEKDPGITHTFIPVRPGPEVFFVTSNRLAYQFSEFDFYDSSTCIFYFKTLHQEFEDYDRGTFSFLDNGDTIYSGSFWPAYMCSMPSGPYIESMPSFYGNYAFRVDYLWHEGQPDPRNSPEMIEVLKDHNLLHSGIALSIDTIEISGNTLDYSFTVTNADATSLLILDPDKTGSALFHYFTNGLYLYDMDHHQVFSSGITHLAPVPWNSWEPGWLSELQPGESKTFAIHDTIITPLIQGDYQAVFEFPGLAFQVAKDQLYQGDARIWLGEVQGSKRIVY